MNANTALATGRRTYLHESAALDFAIRACEALGLVFWALAPGTDIWATDYSQNSFRVHVGKASNGTRVVTGNGRRAYVAVGERRTVAQADQWSLFSIEDQASEHADTAEHAVTIALEPVLGTDSSVYVARCTCGEEFDSISWDDAGYWADRHDASRLDATAATVAAVADTAESLDASSVAVANGYSAEYVRLLDADLEAARTDIERRRLEALRVIATTPVAPTESLEVAAKRMYAVHDQLAELGKDDPGYLVARAMNADSNYFYDQAQARRAGQYVATITDGRKPAPVAPVMITDAHGRNDFTRKVAHALREYDDAAMYGNGDARIAWTHKVLTILAGEYVASVPEYAALAELDDAYRAAETGYCAGLVKWSEYVVAVRNLRNRAVLAGHARLIESIDTWAATLDLESPELAPVLGGEKVSDAPFVADVAPVVAHAAQVVTLAPHRFQSQCDCGWKSATAILASTAKYAAATHVASIRAPFAAGDTVLVRGEGRGTVTAYDGNVSVTLDDGASAYLETSDVTPVADASNRWSTDGNRAYATMVGDFGHALATLTPYRDRYELAIEYQGASNRDVFPVHAGDVHAAIAEAERRVLREAVEASSNDVAPETEFAARVRTARTPKVPGIHVARCYRCGERACETLRLPVSSLTNVCSEHVTEARAVAMRWDESSRYMHAEAPSIANSGRLAVRFTREATNRLDVPLPVIAEALISADNTFGDIDVTLAHRLDAFTAARGTAPSNPVVGK